MQILFFNILILLTHVTFSAFLLKGGYERERVSPSQPFASLAALLVMLLLLHFLVALINVINISAGVHSVAAEVKMYF